ncbi:MAG: DDE-type integrase/transposase/recombinase [Kiritimatiellales bacterium]|jgi:transposase InsO family protein
MQIQAPTTKESLALLRYEVICHIKTLRQEKIPLSESLRAACSRPWPGEGGLYYSYRTIETWWYRHQRHGFPGLSGKAVRGDAGKSRAIDEETGLWIIDAVSKSPGTALSVLYRHWQDHGRGLPSLSSVVRFLKTSGYDRRSIKAGRLESGPTKAFEAPAPNDLWMVDFACGPTLRTAEGRVIATQLCVILDDHSRLIPFAAYYLNGDTASFLDCLKQAVLRRGLPLKLYTDQGKPFVNTHARIVCANLGVRLLHAKPYHAWSKGKVERLIRTIQGDFEATLRLEGGHVQSLAELNVAFSRWVARIYHLRAHGSTNMSPHERFTRAGHPLRTIEEPEKIAPLFYTRMERVVRKDGTVTLGNKLLEVNLALRALKVELRYDPILFDRVEVWHNKSFHGLARKADLHLNSQTYNRGNNYAR